MSFRYLSILSKVLVIVVVGWVVITANPPSVVLSQSGQPCVRDCNEEFRQCKEVVDETPGLEPRQCVNRRNNCIELCSRDASVSFIHVSTSGSQAPNGSITNPYQLIESGICKADRSETILIQKGTYYETLSITKTVTLEASGGSVVVGQVMDRPHTTLTVLTYNTHLFGDEAWIFADLAEPDLDFVDEDRARYIANRIRSENADLVALQEVWDESMAEKIITEVNYEAKTDTYRQCDSRAPDDHGLCYYAFYSEEREESDDILPSGLLLLSKYPFVDPPPIQGFYATESSCLSFWDYMACGAIGAAAGAFTMGNATYSAVTACLVAACGFGTPDAFASKGFVQATIEKDGFVMGIFVTHLDAESSEVRAAQLEQLRLSMFGYQLTNSSTEILLMGDLNIAGEYPMTSTTETFEFITTLPRITNMADAFRNAPCFERNPHLTSDSTTNDLQKYYDSAAENARLDYIFYSHGTFFEVIPIKARLWKPTIEPPLSLNGKETNDLSDHYGILIDFTLVK